MSVVPLGTWVVYKSSPAFSVPGDKPEITPAVLPTFVQCSLQDHNAVYMCTLFQLWTIWPIFMKLGMKVMTLGTTPVSQIHGYHTVVSNTMCVIQVYAMFAVCIYGIVYVILSVFKCLSFVAIFFKFFVIHITILTVSRICQAYFEFWFVRYDCWYMLLVLYF
jgi:hypothetical protein